MITNILIIAALLVSLWDAWMISSICVVLVKNDLLGEDEDE